MTTYHDLDWDSLNFVKQHLYSRLVTALDKAMGRMEIAQHVEDMAEVKAQFKHAVNGLAMALNLIKAWSALIHTGSGGTIDDSQRHPVSLNTLPGWLTEYLQPHVLFQIDTQQTVYVHPEAFFESVVLAVQAGAVAGSLKSLALANAPKDQKGVWLRAVFLPPGTGRYNSLEKLLAALVTGGAREQAVAVKIAVLSDLCRINGAALRLQNNRETGEQALAALFPLGVARAETPDADEAEPADSADELQMAGQVAAPTPREPEATGEAAEQPTPMSASMQQGTPSLAGQVAAPTPRLSEVVANKPANGKSPDDPADAAQPAAAQTATDEPATQETEESAAAQTTTESNVQPGGRLVIVERDATGTIVNASDTVMSPPVSFRDRLMKTTSEVTHQPAGGEQTAPARGAASDEKSADESNAAGEGQPPDPVEPPDDAPSASAE